MAKTVKQILAMDFKVFIAAGRNSLINTDKEPSVQSDGSVAVAPLKLDDLADETRPVEKGAGPHVNFILPETDTYE